MPNMNIEEVTQRLTKQVEECIPLILQEYGRYMPERVKERINSFTDYSKIIKIHDRADVSAYANDFYISLPLCADKILSDASRIPGYGINKKHKPYNDQTIIVNNNTFLTYLIHVFLSGTNAEGYYKDLLLHELLHFCGSGGGTILDEGTNELLTRMIAKKYNLRTSFCGYPKEVRLVYELMNILGEDVIKQLSFIPFYERKIEYIKIVRGEEAAKLYIRVRESSQKEFEEKYYSHMKEFIGATGIAKKVLTYNKLDYKEAYRIIQEYKDKEKTFTGRIK